MSKFARATFEGYLGAPGQIKMPMPHAVVEIEVYRATSNSWRARTVSAAKRGADHSGIEGPPEYVMAEIAKRFTTLTAPWVWVDSEVTRVESPIETENSMHVAGDHGQSRFPLDLKHRYTLCGKVVHMRRVTVDAAGSNCDQCRSIRLHDAGVTKRSSQTEKA